MKILKSNISDGVITGTIFKNSKFINFSANLSPVEVGMLYKGDILVSEIVQNCLLSKPRHSSSDSTKDEINILMEDEIIKKKVNEL